MMTLTDPSRPHSFVCTESKPSNLTVSWKAPEDPAGPLSGYEISASAKGTSPKHWRLLTRTATQYTFTDLDDGTPHIIHLKAFNYDSSVKSGGNSDKHANMLFSDVVKLEVFVAGEYLYIQHKTCISGKDAS